MVPLLRAAKIKYRQHFAFHQLSVENVSSETNVKERIIGKYEAK